MRCGWVRSANDGQNTAFNATAFYLPQDAGTPMQLRCVIPHDPRQHVSPFFAFDGTASGPLGINDNPATKVESAI